jgi:4-amino-4-deoxy-L-arabinose transferase-like glycosyltransferase
MAVWLARNARPVLLILLISAIVLRVLLIAYSPLPFGYVWDFYYEGVRHLARTGRLPVAADCWQCYHPPVFYLLGLPAYVFGRWIGSDAPEIDASGLRWLAGVATLASSVTIYYGYRLLRLFRCGGATLVMGFALLVTFPCLFISSYGAEADIVLTAVLSAFLYYLTRDSRMPYSAAPAYRLGALAGIAAATKYSGLVAIVSACVVCGVRALERRSPGAIRQAALIVLTCALVGGWKYVDNYRQYGTPLYANGSAIQGFQIVDRPDFRAQYEFTTFRIAELMQLAGPRARRGPLTDLPVYHSVPTTLHALAWTDMTFFSEPTRHGDPTHPYPPKRIPALLTRSVLVLGLGPEALAILGFLVTVRRRVFLPLAVMCVVSAGAYVWWFTSQSQWALKTKYLLFLLPAFAVYAAVGLAWLWRRAPRAGIVAGVLVTMLIALTHVYLLAFAVD